MTETKNMFGSLEDQLDFEKRIGLNPSRKKGHVPIAFGALHASLGGAEEITEETFGNVRNNLVGVVRLKRMESEV